MEVKYLYYLDYRLYNQEYLRLIIVRPTQIYIITIKHHTYHRQKNTHQELY